MTDDALFSQALAHVLALEGGYTEDPYDPGGPTNFGITLDTYARDQGVTRAADNLAQLKAELKAIPHATVRRIYRERYWQAASCPHLPPALAVFHFDAAVNQGVGAAARMLQEGVGAAIDGMIGPETLAKAAAQPSTDTLPRYADIRRRHYRALPTFWRFGKGWLARVDRTLAAARALPTAARSPSLHEPKETPTMTDEAPPAAATPPAAPDQPAAPAKWWGSSVTIWGAVVTALSTVLPAVSPLIGLNIPAELVQQLGDQVVVVAQAVGGLAGTILTIYGRARATTTLERLRLTLTV
jgi:lysozyme family protein